MERDYLLSALLESMAESGSVPFHKLTLEEARASALAIVELSGPADETIDTAAFEASGPAGPIAIRRYRHRSSQGTHRRSFIFTAAVIALALSQRMSEFVRL
ncbi:hypothetical protein AGR1A_pAt20600 [Agrobacterium fabacearum CFBP 5771]|uniref:hypothetical protein n=1 Tax=Agrobacterium tumefaciens TaxID=358 RepID=UPI0009CB6978|nr:hypothetical protein [Agrobacterium tumefaciens]CVI24959.1 hypothetical protein AGR1A_pAt20600 [Agrobacterium fabacearum CFBP 5771]